MKNLIKTQVAVIGPKIKTSMVLLAAALIAMITPPAATAGRPSHTPTATLLVSGLEGSQGSTVGPDGALYVTENLEGRIWRVDPKTGQVTTFASGLPAGLFGIGNGGVVDVAFIGKTAYALVTDANLNRVLRVTLDGEISVFIDFDNIVPTGLAVFGDTVLMAEGGPDPHTPQTGTVVSFGPKSSTATEVASGVPWVLDVQFGLGRTLYALSFGTFDPNTESLNLAVPNTGALVKVNGDGTFTVVVHGLNQPTSLQFIGNTAYVVTLTGEIWRIDGLSGPPYGPAPVTVTAADTQNSRSGAQ